MEIDCDRQKPFPPTFRISHVLPGGQLSVIAVSLFLSTHIRNDRDLSILDDRLQIESSSGLCEGG